MKFLYSFVQVLCSLYKAEHVDCHTYGLTGVHVCPLVKKEKQKNLEKGT